MTQPGKADAAFRLMQASDLEGASRLFLAALSRTPRDFVSRAALATCQYRLGKHDTAIFHARLALEHGADDENIFSDAAQILAKAGKPHEAIERMERACAAHPTWAVLRSTLGLLYAADQRSAEAERVLRESVAIDPHQIWSRLGLAKLLANDGHADEAMVELDKIIAEFPPEQAVLENAAFVSNSAEHLTPHQVFAYHAKLGRHFARHADEQDFVFPRTDDPDRPLRVAFVTHDLNNHAVSFFLEAPLRYLSRQGLRTIVYYTGAVRDQATELLESLPDESHHLPNLPSVPLARRVYNDKIDVLIDTSGWTSGHRLHAFQLRPAPVQMTWLGYPNTTGLRTVDYRIIDSITDPPGAERFASEQLLRLDPCFLCYAPITGRPWIVPVGWKPPARSTDPNRPITFGSYNNLTKITDTALATWARIVLGVPGSKLMVKGRGLAQPESRERFGARLLRAGLAADRWMVMPHHDSPADHLASYASIDIALDTFPYNGTTTTCETLLMGVPLVTLLGDRHVSRVSASLLTALGEAALVARSLDDYVHIAIELAHNREKLSHLHGSLSARFLASPLCDARAFSERFAHAIRAAWNARCEHGVGHRP